MIAVLEIILAVFGFGFALAPIGGETWIKDEPKILKRITWRGWIAIILLTLSLVVSIYKTIETTNREQASNIQLQKLEQGLNNLSKGFQSTAKKLETFSQTNGANKKLDQGVTELRKDIQINQRELLKLRRSLLPASNPKSQTKLPGKQSQEQQIKAVDDDYHEITKPIMEVKQ